VIFGMAVGLERPPTGPVVFVYEALLTFVAEVERCS